MEPPSTWRSRRASIRSEMISPARLVAFGIFVPCFVVMESIIQVPLEMATINPLGKPAGRHGWHPLPVPCHRPGTRRLPGLWPMRIGPHHRNTRSSTISIPWSTPPCQHYTDSGGDGQDQHHRKSFFDLFVFHHGWTIAQWERMATIPQRIFQPADRQTNSAPSTTTMSPTEKERPTQPMDSLRDSLDGLLDRSNTISAASSPTRSVGIMPARR